MPSFATPNSQPADDGVPLEQPGSGGVLNRVAAAKKISNDTCHPAAFAHELFLERVTLRALPAEVSGKDLVFLGFADRVNRLPIYTRLQPVEISETVSNSWSFTQRRLQEEWGSGRRS